MPHHYTSIDTLELILRHRTIRFTRLDRFDDVTEGRSLGRFPAGSRLYASCWSDEDSENIPQWEMYAGKSTGVRLTLPVAPFHWHRIDINWNENFQVRDLETPFSIETMLGKGIILVPHTRMRETFGQRVQYVEDVTASIEGLYQDVDGVLTLKGDGTEIAFFKPLDWSFQKEFRYVLQAMGGPNERFSGDVERYLQGLKEWTRSGVNFVTHTPELLHVDLPLDPEALSKASITIGPLATAEQIERVELLVRELAPSASIGRSALTGKIRPKN